MHSTAMSVELTSTISSKLQIYAKVNGFNLASIHHRIMPWKFRDNISNDSEGVIVLTDKHTVSHKTDIAENYTIFATLRYAVGK